MKTLIIFFISLVSLNAFALRPQIPTTTTCEIIHSSYPDGELPFADFSKKKYEDIAFEDCIAAAHEDLGVYIVAGTLFRAKIPRQVTHIHYRYASPELKSRGTLALPDKDI